MTKWIKNVWYSFPVQLVVLHLKNHLLLSAIWLLLGAIMTGAIADLFGMKYLFWSPEYLGAVNFWSFFFLGLCFASFVMTWNLTTYMLSSHHFPFLASLRRPFTKFCINNFIIPVFFISLIIALHIRFEIAEGLFAWRRVFYNALGFLFGLLTLVAGLLVYFIYTNKNILYYIPPEDEDAPPHTVGVLSPRSPVNLQKLRSEVVAWRVDTYLTESFLPRPVRSVSHYSIQTLLRVFKQNHTNALVVQMLSLMVLIVLGVLIENPNFRIPAAASLLLAFSIGVALIGAISYWFQNWSFFVFVLIFLSLNYLTKQGFFNYENKAYGLDYKKERPIYQYDSLQTTFHQALIEKDKANTIKILENWKRNTLEEKPQMILVCVSGGGLKSATWSMKVLQTLDSLTNSDFMRHTVLMSGASGGMIGMAYFRELYWRHQQGDSIDIYKKSHINDISKDLLNPIAFTIVTNDLFVPKGNFKIGDKKYQKDRGFIFEQQLNENTHYRMRKTIADYELPERNGQIPMLFITPYIVNDARRLVISPHSVTYMMRPPTGGAAENYTDIDAIDFQHLFKDLDASELQFTSALRMNATFPYVLPRVTLPTHPDIEVMDAGYRDNFGLKSAVRFTMVFQDWIKANTAGVTFVVIRGIDRNSREIEASDNDGIIQSLVDPLGVAGKLLSLQDYEHDTSIGVLYQLFGDDFFKILSFDYRPITRSEKASMTFHLTQRERADILAAIQHEENQANVTAIQQLFMSYALSEKQN